MKTLTLRDIPEDVQNIIKKNSYNWEPATKAIFRVIRLVPDLKIKIAELEALKNDSKT